MCAQHPRLNPPCRDSKSVRALLGDHRKQGEGHPRSQDLGQQSQHSSLNHYHSSSLIHPSVAHLTESTMPSLELKTNVKLDNPKQFIEEFSKVCLAWVCS